MPASLAQETARHARDSATGLGDDYRDLSARMCWDAAASCVVRAGGATPRPGTITADRFGDYVRLTDPIVGDADAMRKVPQGTLLGFVELRNGTPTLVHAMVATGHGLAAGNKNDCVGVGKSVGWEILDLAGGLKWIDGAKAISAPSPLSPGGRRLTVYAREL